MLKGFRVHCRRANLIRGFAVPPLGRLWAAKRSHLIEVRLTLGEVGTIRLLCLGAVLGHGQSARRRAAMHLRACSSVLCEDPQNQAGWLACLTVKSVCSSDSFFSKSAVEARGRWRSRQAWLLLTPLFVLCQR